MIAPTEIPVSFDVNKIAQEIMALAEPGSGSLDKGDITTGRFAVSDLVMAITHQCTLAYRQGAADLDDELARAKSVVQDMTTIIAAKCEQERTLAEQIAQAIGPMLDPDTSDMELPELVGALIDFALSEHARAQVMSMEPEEAPGVFLVLNAEGRITGPFHNSDGDARAYINQFGRSSSQFMVARRVASCTTRIAADWKEG